MCDGFVRYQQQKNKWYVAKANRSCWHSIEINENRCKQNKQRSHMQSKMYNERLNVDFITSNEITI